MINVNILACLTSFVKQNVLPLKDSTFFSWWRWRESNSRPITFPHRLLRVQFVIKFPANLFNKQNLFAVVFKTPTNTKDTY